MAARGTRYFVEWGGESHEVAVRQGDAGLEVVVNDVVHPVDVTAVEGGELLNLLIDGESHTYAARFEDGAAMLSFHDREVRVPIEDERGRMARLATGAGARGGAGDSEIKSVMPGVVKEILVEADATVEAGQALLILEAMKMENEIRAPRDGAVGSIHVEAGQAVDKGALLIKLSQPQGTQDG